MHNVMDTKQGQLSTTTETSISLWQLILLHNEDELIYPLIPTRIPFNATLATFLSTYYIHIMNNQHLRNAAHLALLPRVRFARRANK